MFSLHIFCSILIEQVINLRKVRTENFKFRKEVMNGWSVTKLMMILSIRNSDSESSDCLKNIESKLNLTQSMQISKLLSKIAFHLQPTANFGCIR